MTGGERVSYTLGGQRKQGHQHKGENNGLSDFGKLGNGSNRVGVLGYESDNVDYRWYRGDRGDKRNPPILESLQAYWTRGTTGAVGEITMKRLTQVIRHWQRERYRQRKIAEAYRAYDCNRAKLENGGYYGA